MSANNIITFAAAVLLSVAATRANETLIVSNVLGPEGPLYVDGNLYYVGWVSNTLSKWDGKTTTVLNHTGLAGITGWRSRNERRSSSRAPRSMAPSLNST